MDDFELEIKKEFLGEAIMNLEEVEGSFMELESASDPKPLLDKIFRLAHNLKGGSRAVGFSDVAEFTHELENLVLKIQKGEIPLSSEIITTLLQSNDRLVEMMSELKGNLAATFDNSDLILELQAWISGSRVAAESKDSSTVPAEAEQLITGEDENFEVKSEFEGESSQEIPNANNFFAKETTDVSENSTPGMSSEGGEALSVSQAQARRVKTRASDTAGKEDEIIRVSLSKID